ncbi:unnamed protein product [Lactuca virosa]|uniref:Uncharacterized protein n=1 Tax=Lactuca virosa TaxID=75947 RepID=A0AAU9P558_9ASTR|nr:unnamed protein product [Lactuca virosa]
MFMLDDTITIITSVFGDKNLHVWKNGSSQQPLAARDYASSTIIPTCNVVIDISNAAKDLIEQDNTLYMLPSTPQALLDLMDGSTGPDAIIVAEKNVALLTPRAGSDAYLASVLESMEFCLKLRGSEACVLEDLAKAINLVHIKKDLVESGHALLNHAYHNQQEY